MSDDATTARHWAVLEMLAHVSESVRMWLSGGWALDFHCGRVTRPHSDIDVIVHEDDRKRFWDVLQAAGVCDRAVESSAAVETVECLGVQVEGTYVYRERDTIRARAVEHWPWPTGSFEDPPKRFQNLDFPVVSVEGLLDMKTRYEEFFGEPMRAHDKADAQLLADLSKRRPPQS